MSQNHYCCFCTFETELSHYSSTKLLQEQLLQAINILGLLVEHAPDKKITIATHTFNTEEVAITTLNLISLEQKLHTLNSQLNITQPNNKYL